MKSNAFLRDERTIEKRKRNTIILSRRERKEEKRREKQEETRLIIITIIHTYRATCGMGVECHVGGKLHEVRTNEGWN